MTYVTVFQQFLYVDHVIIYVECIAKKGDFDMYTVRFQLELSGSEKRFLSKSFRIMKPGRKVFWLI